MNYTQTQLNRIAKDTFEYKVTEEFCSCGYLLLSNGNLYQCVNQDCMVVGSVKDAPPLIRERLI